MTREIKTQLGFSVVIFMIIVVVFAVVLLLDRVGERQAGDEYRIYRLTANQRNIEFFLAEKYGSEWVGYRKGMADLMRLKEEAEYRRNNENR